MGGALAVGHDVKRKPGQPFMLTGHLYAVKVPARSTQSRLPHW
jgi:hypothetical protein